MEDEQTFDGFPVATGEALVGLLDGLRELVAIGKSIVVLNEACARALLQPPALHRRRRYAAQARRRRNEMLRQMAAYQRRQQAREQA